MNQPHQTVMIRTTVRLLVPVAQLYALYVIFHGHYSPGGGFQGGTVLAATYILIALALGSEELERRFSEHTLAIMAGIGVAIFAGVGALSFTVGGAAFLDYGVLEFLGDQPPYRRSIGILLVEIGVAVTVAAGLLLIFMRLADREEA